MQTFKYLLLTAQRCVYMNKIQVSNCFESRKLNNVLLCVLTRIKSILKAAWMKNFGSASIHTRLCAFTRFLCSSIRIWVVTFRHLSSESSRGYRAILWIQDGCLRTTWPSRVRVGSRQACLVIQSFILSRRCCDRRTLGSG